MTTKEQKKRALRAMKGGRFVLRPKSKTIAAGLNRSSASKCEHGRKACYLRCGVIRRIEGIYPRWDTMDFQERLQWLYQDVEALVCPCGGKAFREVRRVSGLLVHTINDQGEQIHTDRKETVESKVPLHVHCNRCGRKHPNPRLRLEERQA